MPYTVRYSQDAATQLGEMKGRAERAPGSPHETAYKAVARLLRDVLTNEDLVLHRDFKLAGNLAGVFRVKAGRLRIFYIASSKHQRAIVLFIGYRKKGDRKDAYAEAQRRIHADEFDDLFAELETKRPGRTYGAHGHERGRGGKAQRSARKKTRRK